MSLLSLEHLLLRESMELAKAHKRIAELELREEMIFRYMVSLEAGYQECITGDCSHDTWQECRDSLKTSFEKWVDTHKSISGSYESLS